MKSSKKDFPSRLVLTGEADQEIVFIHHPGLRIRRKSSLRCLGMDGHTISGLPEDTVFPTGSVGTFYVSDTGGNAVYKLSATGLTKGSVFIDVGDEFGQLNLSTGVVTPIFTGVSPHGVTFVASPEPAFFVPLAGAVLALKIFRFGKRRVSDPSPG
jgi:hypothetical protein